MCDCFSRLSFSRFSERSGAPKRSKDLGRGRWCLARSPTLPPLAREQLPEATHRWLAGLEKCPGAVLRGPPQHPQGWGITCQRTANNGGPSCTAGDLSHRLPGILEQLLVPGEAGGWGGCAGIPRPQLATLKSVGGRGGEPSSPWRRGGRMESQAPSLAQVGWALPSPGVWRALWLRRNKGGAGAFGAL